MSKLLDAAAARALRGLVLSMAGEAAPLGVSTAVIKSALRLHGYSVNEEEALIVCRYLEGRGLIRMESLKNDVLKVGYDIAHITPGGMDVLDGMKPADGIELEG